MQCMCSSVPKGTSQAKATLNCKKIKTMALATVELHWFVSIESSLKNFKFCINLLKVFQIDLKACLGLVLPNPCCSIVIYWGVGKL